MPKMRLVDEINEPDKAGKPSRLYFDQTRFQESTRTIVYRIDRCTLLRIDETATGEHDATTRIRRKRLEIARATSLLSRRKRQSSIRAEQRR